MPARKAYLGSHVPPRQSGFDGGELPAPEGLTAFLFFRRDSDDFLDIVSNEDTTDDLLAFYGPVGGFLSVHTLSSPGSARRLLKRPSETFLNIQ